MAVYSPLDNILTMDGYQIKGFQTVANAIEFKTSVERVTAENSIDGQAQLNINPNKAGMLTIRLLASHPDNNKLAAYYQALELGGSCPPILTQLKRNGGDFVIAGAFLPVGPSEGEMGVENTTREWRFISAGAIAFTGAFTGD